MGKLRHVVFSAMLAIGAQASANSTGSIVCSVGALPFSPMSSVLTTPAPSGWVLQTNARYYRVGEAIEFRISNTNPSVQLRGILLWGQFGDLSPAGSFDLGDGLLWRYVAPSPGVQCNQGSITHQNKLPKNQSELVFTWTPPSSGEVRLQAFLIDHCDSNLNTNCRGAQFLTQVIALNEALFVDSFE
jgi:hypothetical protein